MRSAQPSGSSLARSWAGTSPLRDAATGTLRMSQESQCKHWRTEPMQHDGEAVRCRGTSVKTSSESFQVAPMMEFGSAITILCIVCSAILHGNVSRVIDSHLLHEPATFALTDFCLSCNELEPHTIEPPVCIELWLIVWILTSAVWIELGGTKVDRTMRGSMSRNCSAHTMPVLHMLVHNECYVARTLNI